ncbi:MAG: ABC transporter permease subunit [SAR324 cluster bacterium]|nr:ABC transporter permease subunit [SAR324 cluster bacterium]
MQARSATRAKRIDRIATWTITASGLVIVGSVVGILLLIVNVALPLLFPPDSVRVQRFSPAWLGDPGAVLAIGSDGYLETGYVLDTGGVFTFFDSRCGALLERVRLERPGVAGATVAGVEVSGRLDHSLRWSDGSLTVERVRFFPQFDPEGQRHIAHAVERLTVLPPAEGAVRGTARVTEAGGTAAVFLLPGNRLRVVQQIVEEDLFGELTRESASYEIEDELPGAAGPLLLDGSGRWLFAGTDAGYLLRWALTEEGPRLADRVRASHEGSAVTALAMLIGDGSVVVGLEDGSLSVWFPVPAEPGSFVRVLKSIHTLAPHPAAVRRIVASQADRILLTVGEEAELRMHYPTGERHLLTLSPEAPLLRAGLSLRANGVIGLDAEGRITVWAIDAPHPEFSWKAMFSRIWYEGFEQPGFVWQSSAATDDAEPKLSLIPLVFGTLKATFYALLFAAPVALFAAIYTSSLMDPRLRLIVKPTVEVMGAVPTVVIGFLAALWFAPLIEDKIIAIFLFLLLAPVVLIAFFVLWERVRGWPPLNRVKPGYEFLLVMPAVLLTVVLSVAIGGVLQDVIFGGDFRQWLFQSFGTQVDQRNSIVIAFALGFAVIPIIFTISEDALIRVPGHLRAASLALGATRWQTAWRVVLPSASPGVFAAVMIGFGRAVGETMIVLMATGNTPIIDGSIFNGMRTLSANIAVEIPEAPAGGTLFRVLFLTAVLLFSATFLVNTAAEVVRERMRKKFGRI